MTQTEGDEGHGGCRDRAGERCCHSAHLPADKAHHENHRQPGHRLGDCIEVGELPVCRPAFRDDYQVVNTRENGRNAAEADERQQGELRCEGNGRGWAAHSAFGLMTPATAMLSGTNPTRTVRSGNLAGMMPAKASAAKNSAAGRRRCGISILIPVAMSSPAAAADIPPRTFLLTAGCGYR